MAVRLYLASAIQDKMDRLTFFWEDIKTKADEREMKLLDVLELAEKFWLDMNALLTTIKDTHEIVHDLESPGIDPSMIKQQIEAADVRNLYRYFLFCSICLNCYRLLKICFCIVL